jgi:hypothetical protein
MGKLASSRATVRRRVRVALVDRPLTDRERAVLDALLAINVDGIERLRKQAAEVRVVGMCECGCPSIDFHKQPGVGMSILVNAGVRGTYDGLFLYALDGRLGGIEYVSNADAMPVELPAPSELEIEAAGR